MQAMVALAALPFKWEHLIHIIINNYEMEALTFEVVKDAIINQWDTETNRGGHKGSHNAQKLSAVKRKRGDPRLTSSRVARSSALTTLARSSIITSAGGQRGKGKGKGKRQGQTTGLTIPGHVHIASIAGAYRRSGPIQRDGTGRITAGVSDPISADRQP